VADTVFFYHEFLNVPNDYYYILLPYKCTITVVVVVCGPILWAVGIEFVNISSIKKNDL